MIDSKHKKNKFILLIDRPSKNNRYYITMIKVFGKQLPCITAGFLATHIAIIFIIILIVNIIAKNSMAIIITTAGNIMISVLLSWFMAGLASDCNGQFWDSPIIPTKGDPIDPNTKSDD